MDATPLDRYRAVATSAAREAKNGDLFVERAEREAGLHVEIIEGAEEGRLVQLAVSERVDVRGKNAVLVDIGGGSTELTLLRGEPSPKENPSGQPVAVFSRSLPVGTVRLIEAFLNPGSKVTDHEKRLLVESIDRVLSGALGEIQSLCTRPIEVVLGTGGNIETLADLCPVAPAPPVGRAIDVNAMGALFQDLCSLSADERTIRFGLRPDRADTIVPAVAILRYLAQNLGLTTLAAPGVGLKEGVLLDLARRHFLPEDFPSVEAALSDACVRFGRRYHFDEAHGILVARLAVRLFDDLGKHHRLGPRDRILLHAAALLHDVGDFVRYEGHHKHSYYLIAHSDFVGLSAQERLVVANIARYHRKSPPSPDHENYRVLSREDRSRVKALAAILRVADALDREHRGKIQDVKGAVIGDTLELTLSGAKERDLEEWTAHAKSGLLKEAFGLELSLEDVPLSTPKSPLPRSRRGGDGEHRERGRAPKESTERPPASPSPAQRLGGEGPAKPEGD